MRSILLILFLLTSVGHAQDKQQDLWRNNSKVILGYLLKDKGIEKIGDLDLDELKTKMNTVNWEFQKKVFYAGSGENRFSSIYTIEENKVVLNTLFLQFTPKEAVPVLALHEGLGALGYSDENYERSTALWLRTFKKDPETLRLSKELWKNIKIRKKGKIYNSEGGVTGVGGGGDGTAIYLKMMLISYLQSYLKSKDREKEYDNFLRKLMKIGVEYFASNSSKERIEIQKKDKVTLIRVNMLAWLNAHKRGEKEQRRFVLKCLDKLIGKI